MTPQCLSKAAALRQLLYSDEFTPIAGAHDALCSRLAESAGFAALWASGLGISAVNGVPDASVLGMRDILQSAQAMNLATTVPVMVDCDSGFGDIENVRQLVRHFEAAGIAGVCIEDKVHPKRNSLGNGKQELEPLDVFTAKIEMAKATQRDPDFVVVARTEALIAGAGITDAIERASAYEAAGADAILIHSRLHSVDEVASLTHRWRSSVPMLALPTMFPQVTEDEFAELGFAGCIYANQALRGCLQVIRHVYREMRAHRSAFSVDAEIASVAEVLALYEAAPPPDGAARAMRRFPGLEVTPVGVREEPARAIAGG